MATAPSIELQEEFENDEVIDVSLIASKDTTLTFLIIIFPCVDLILLLKFDQPLRFAGHPLESYLAF